MTEEKEREPGNEGVENIVLRSNNYTFCLTISLELTALYIVFKISPEIIIKISVMYKYSHESQYLLANLLMFHNPMMLAAPKLLQNTIASLVFCFLLGNPKTMVLRLQMRNQTYYKSYHASLNMHAITSSSDQQTVGCHSFDMCGSQTIYICEHQRPC